MRQFGGWLGALCLMLALGACAPRTDSGVYVLRYASNYPPGHPFSRADITWMQAVEKASNGRIHIQPFWGGSLIRNDNSVIALRHGVADVALITPIYMRSGMQAVKTQTGFYSGARTVEEQVRVYRCLEQEFPVFDQELWGVKVLAVQGGNLPNVLTRNRPVHDLADLRGLRLRAPDETAPVLRQLGVDPVTMPMGDVYSAMSKGVIDGVVAPADALKSMHFTEVGHYMNLLVVDRGAYPARAISDQAWKRLPPDLQQVLVAQTPVWEAALAKEVTGAEQAGIETGQVHKTVFVPFGAADQATYDATAKTVSMQGAQALRRYGVDGPAIFNRAQAIIAADAAGKPAGCPAAKPA